jgi:hypothetical protein
MVAEEKDAVSTSAEQGIGEVRQKRGLLGQVYPPVVRGEAQHPSPNIPRHYPSFSVCSSVALASKRPTDTLAVHAAEDHQHHD